MNCNIEKSRLNGRIVCPANKSYTHRAIFLAALSDGKSIVKKILRSNDTIATINACRGFGVEVSEVENNVTIKNTINETVQSSIINAENSGTTIRIAIAIAAIAITPFCFTNLLDKLPNCVGTHLSIAILARTAGPPKNPVFAPSIKMPASNAINVATIKPLCGIPDKICLNKVAL